MCYNAETGHWVKEPQAFVGWAHSELKLQDFHLKQCLYGEHLLTNSSSPVMLVESEKTAVVMSHFSPIIYGWQQVERTAASIVRLCRFSKAGRLLLFLI